MTGFENSEEIPHVDLCVRLLVYAAISPKTKTRTPEELKTALGVFFEDKTIEKALSIITNSRSCYMDNF